MHINWVDNVWRSSDKPPSFDLSVLPSLLVKSGWAGMSHSQPCLTNGDKSLSTNFGDESFSDPFTNGDKSHSTSSGDGPFSALFN